MRLSGGTKSPSRPFSMNRQRDMPAIAAGMATVFVTVRTLPEGRGNILERIKRPRG
jgi:hypothetical protein